MDEAQIYIKKHLKNVKNTEKLGEGEGRGVASQRNNIFYSNSLQTFYSRGTFTCSPVSIIVWNDNGYVIRISLHGLLAVACRRHLR